MQDLKSSKWAPRTPAEQQAFSRTERLKQDKEKASRLLSRLRWKAESLMASYNRAMDILRSETGNGHMNAHSEHCYAFALGTSSKQAESMFKVDFFEFYTLLERYITLCLAVLGVNVSSGSNGIGENVNALRYITNPDLQRTRPLASHQFHANLLTALDQPNSPLASSFGNQDVRIQLSIAKDYRNRWKDDNEQLTGNRTIGSVWGSEDEPKRQPVKLENLELLHMLTVILAGCEYALKTVQGSSSDANLPYTTSAFEQHYGAVDTEYAPMEYLDDPMDLD
ncbi:hypothetical protein CC78DRAFT_77514 [Lojkania enalia]|uniref:Uncharacterized protein n=1 Tax=Lojkania enalia TaxID=147567 RepID=A0A9P4N2M3_9PLEO|nr:hypothetical protein CC78DRAFT_77514 [Didymosphaeria enalia]